MNKRDSEVMGEQLISLGYELADADDGADVVVVACPLCHINLDSRQKQIEEEFGETFNLSILYFTQLMGLAFEVAPKELGLQKHFVDPFPLLREKGII